MTTPHPVTIHPPNDGRTIGIMGDIYRFGATGAETNGRYTIIEAIVPPGGGAPLHLHTREDETFYVLEGQFTLKIGDETLVAGPGTFVNLPIGNPHSFRNESEETARVLISFTPSGLEDYFFAIGQQVDYGELPPKPTPEEIDKMIKLAPSYGIKFLEG